MMRGHATYRRELLGPEGGLEAARFCKDQLLQRLFGQVVQLHVKGEGRLSHGLPGPQDHSVYHVSSLQ